MRRLTDIGNKIMLDKRKVSKASAIIRLLSTKEYNKWIKLLSKCASPEEQELKTAEYFKKIGKYEQLQDHVRII